MIKVPVGIGDIKYGAVAGFYFGALGFIEVMLVMSAAELIYLGYLLITGKGNWKTWAPMGPYISVGMLFTALFPLI